MQKRLIIRVDGTVQGVFFRHSAIVKAKELGLGGFVRNEPDGVVYIEAEGEETDLKKLLDWCRKGPPRARVKNVEFSFSDADGRFENFEIR